jgi:hypothetical protein
MLGVEEARGLVKQHLGETARATHTRVVAHLMRGLAEHFSPRVQQAKAGGGLLAAAVSAAASLLKADLVRLKGRQVRTGEVLQVHGVRAPNERASRIGPLVSANLGGVGAGDRGQTPRFDAGN